jgi:hypothetical protein
MTAHSKASSLHIELIHITRNSQTLLVPEINTINILFTLHCVNLYPVTVGLYWNTISPLQACVLSTQFTKILFLPHRKQYVSTTKTKRSLSFKEKKSLLWESYKTQAYIM